MEKSGQQHQEESDQVAEQIASDFCAWLRALPKGETEDINYTSPEYIRQLFDEQVYQGINEGRWIYIVYPMDNDFKNCNALS